MCVQTFIAFIYKTQLYIFIDTDKN